MNQQDPIICIHNLHKCYGEKEVLRGIDLEIYPGEVIGYIGPNGAGKSTTVKILAGLINDFEGSITIDGKDLRGDILDIKAIMGYVPENAELYDVLSPLEYLDFVGKLYGMKEHVIVERATKLLNALGLGEQVHKRMNTFSKGMRQKVLLVSGIIHNPKILILDEPLSGLDANAVITVKELIGRLAKEGKTIFYCSHMMDVVEKVSNRILLINEGRIVANGSFEQLQQEHGNSLEHIFAKLTGQKDATDSASQIISAFE